MIIYGLSLLEKTLESSEILHLPDEVIWLLEEGLFGYLGTSSKDRIPHVTPVIFIFDGRYIWFFTSKITKKLRNIKENIRVSFLIDVRDPSNLHNNKAVLIHGTVKTISILYAIFHLKYLLKIKRIFHQRYPKYMNAYKTERAKISKRWRTKIFIHRILLRLTIEKFVYMKESRPNTVE